MSEDVPINTPHSADTLHPGNKNYIYTPQKNILYTRPLPSCLTPRLKTGTDLVKKQEVMKRGLGRANRIFPYPDLKIPRQLLHAEPRETFSVLKQRIYNLHLSSGTVRGTNTCTSQAEGRPQTHLRGKDKPRKHAALPFPQNGFL